MTTKTVERTVSAPYIDLASKKRTPEWLVTVKQGTVVQTYRFYDQERAQAFVDGGAK